MQLDEVAAVAALRGEPQHVSAAGVTRTGGRLTTIENVSPFGTGSRRRLVLAADDERAARACVAAIHWLKTAAPRQLRDRWEVSAVLLSMANDVAAQRLVFPPADGFFNHPDQPESRYVWRWAAYQAPDVLVQIRGGDVLSRATPPHGSLAAALAGGSEMGTVHAMFITARETDGPALLQYALKDVAGQESEVHATLRSRAGRAPLDLAGVLAARYPQTSFVSYIPSVAWANTLRVSDVLKRDELRQKVMEQTRPWRSRERPLFTARPALTVIAGTLIYADLALRGEQTAEPLAVQGAEDALKVAPTGFAEYGQGWTDDMFMLASILSRSGRMRGRTGDVDHLARMLVAYAERLQRPDGVFVHFTDGRIPWGRGNGFAALGLADALTAMSTGGTPAKHPAHAALLEIYRRHMNGMKLMQAPDGMWRQVVDEPGAYREQSVTAMTLTAMARGVRLGWLAAGAYRPVIDRAWRALAAHVTGDGAIVDVCTSTGSQPTLQHYLDRQAISGFDDRGGAMALLASMEMYDLSRAG